MTAGASPEISFAVHPAPDPVPTARRAELMEAPGFGRVFTDHMITLRWTPERGWHDGRWSRTARSGSSGPPRCSTTPRRSSRASRPTVSTAGRSWRSGLRQRGRVPKLGAAAGHARAARGCLRPGHRTAGQPGPGLGARRRRHSLYLRPFMIATDTSLGVSKPSSSYLYVVIASPAGAVLRRRRAPVSVWLASEYTRAAPGGTGAAKAGGNYAAGFAAQRRRWSTAATRSSGWTPSSTAGWRRWAA